MPSFGSLYLYFMWVFIFVDIFFDFNWDFYGRDVIKNNPVHIFRGSQRIYLAFCFWIWYIFSKANSLWVTEWYFLWWGLWGPWNFVRFLHTFILMLFETVVLEKMSEIRGRRHFIYCLVCALFCNCSLIDITITGRDNGFEFEIYVFLLLETSLKTQIK